MKWWPFKKRNREDDEIVISSEFPYRVGTTEEEGMLTYKTFTKDWCYETERKEIYPVKVIYNDEILFQLSLYLPARKFHKAVNESRNEDLMMNLWIFLDDDNFFIVFPDECDMGIDERGEMIGCTFLLSNVGFHSAKGDLNKSLGPAERCRFIVDELIKHDIVSIMQKLFVNDETIEFEPIKVLSPTRKYIREAVRAIKDYIGKYGGIYLN